MFKTLLFLLLNTILWSQPIDPLRPFQMGLPAPKYKVEPVEKSPKYKSQNHCSKPFAELVEAVDSLTRKSDANASRGSDVEIPDLYDKNGKIEPAPKKNSLDIEI